MTHFVDNGENVLLDFVDSDGSGGNAPVLEQRYLHGGSVDEVLAQESGTGEVFWHLSDHLGTIRELVDNNGAVANHLTYDSYGNVVNETDGTIDTRYLFTGREFDDETGLYYYRARYYDAGIGRFISEDPIGFAGGDENLYRYVWNNSTHWIDPSGLFGMSRGAGLISNTAKGIAADSIVPQRYTIRADFGGSSTVAGLMDMSKGRIKAGKPVGSPLIRFDNPHGGTSYPHININPRLTGVPDPHTPISPSLLRNAGRVAKGLKRAQRIAVPVAAGLDAARLGKAYMDDGYCFGDNFIGTAGSVGGGWAGAFGGAWGGAKVGAAIGGTIGTAIPGVGNVVGAGIGGFVGGLAGGIGGSYGGSVLGENLSRRVF